MGFETMSKADDRRARAEAGAWLARLRSELRTPADEIGFQAWLADDDRHHRAFEAVTSVYEAAGAVATTSDLDSHSGAPLLGRRRVLAGGAVFATATVATGFGIWRWNDGLLQTATGQQSRIALDDGSHLMLDTGSAARVRFTGQRRLVDLVAGRAHFNVASDIARPFIVRAGDQEVIAVGTAFTVSRLESRISVFLEEGKVVVREHVAEGDDARPTERPMVPGDRLVFSGNDSIPTQDRPDPLQVSAWESGRAIFVNETLFAAVEEINRYNRGTIEIADARAANQKISGVFRTDDPAGFARAVALLLPVDVDAADGDLVLRSRAE